MRHPPGAQAGVTRPGTPVTVEVAGLDDGSRAVRDSKDRTGPVLRFTPLTGRRSPPASATASSTDPNRHNMCGIPRHEKRPYYFRLSKDLGRSPNLGSGATAVSVGRVS